MSLAASPQAAAQDEPDKVAIGVYINDIYDLELTSNSFNADIYVWLRWSNRDIDPSASFEVMNPFGFDGGSGTSVRDARRTCPTARSTGPSASGASGSPR